MANKTNAIQAEARASSPYEDPTIRRVDYGVKAVYIAPWEGGALGETFRQLGATAFTNTISQEQTPIYADDQIHQIIMPDPTVSGEVTFLQIDDQLKELTGWYKNANGIWTSTGVSKQVALMYLKETFNGSEKALSAFIAYNVTLGKPDEDSATTTDTTDALTYTCAFTGSSSEYALDDMGNASALANFYTPKGYGFAQVDEAIISNGIPLPNQGLNLVDTVPPTINRSGNATIDYEVDAVKKYGDLLTDGGITVMDNVDGNLSSSVVYTEGGSTKLSTDTIDTTSATITDKTVTLSVTDLAGNEATPVDVKYSVTAPA
jgi:hypothetical protein